MNNPQGNPCSLTDRDCVPCQGGVPPLCGKAIDDLHKQLLDEWAVVNEHHLEKEFTFADFKEALAYTNKVGALAEQQGHHPDIHLSWGKVKLTIWTHKINGLTKSDFVFAAKADALY